MTIRKAVDVYRTAWAVLWPHKSKCPRYYTIRGPLRDRLDNLR